MIHRLKIKRIPLKISSSKPLICNGENVSISASEGFETYLWSTGESSQSISVSEPQTYSVTATNNGCSFTESISIGSNIAIQDFSNGEFYQLAIDIINIDALTGKPEEDATKTLSNAIVRIDNHPDEELDLLDIIDRFATYDDPDYDTPEIYTLISSNETLCGNDFEEAMNQFNSAQTAIWVHVFDGNGDDDYIMFKGKSNNILQGKTSPVSDEHINYIDELINISLELEENESLNKSENTFFIILELLLGEFSMLDVDISTDLCDNVTIPFRTQAPESDISIEDYIELIEQEEERLEVAFPGISRNTKKMITILRRLFYNTDAWNNYIIPGTDGPNLQSPYGSPYTVTNERIPVYSRYLGEGNGVSYTLDINETYPSIDGTIDGQPEIYQKRGDVRLTLGRHAGLKIDIAHVFAGLDAYNYASQLCPSDYVAQGIIDNTIVNCLPNTQASLFAGDLASSVVFSYIPTRRLFPTLVARNHPSYIGWVQNAIDRGSPPEDLIGNVDPIVINKLYNIGATSNGPKVSEIFRHYYLNQNRRTTFFNFNTPQDNRFLIYATELGLVYFVNQDEFINDEWFVEEFSANIASASVFFLAQKAKGTDFITLSLASPDIVRLKFKGLNKDILKCYVKSLEAILQEEY